MLKQPFHITILTLFPEMFPGPLGVSILGRALQKNLWELSTINIRDFAHDKHRTVDDTPYGGGAGMVMRADIVAAAIRAAKEQNPGAPVVFLTPSGRRFTQGDAWRWVQTAERGARNGVILLCGHYEGIDQRVLNAEVDEELSIGDYVLSGGELGAMVLTDAVIRLLPDVLGTQESLKSESFDITDELGRPLLEYPHYTRPETWEGQSVPEVLRSGNHKEIEKWRQNQAKTRTRERRPDLLGE